MVQAEGPEGRVEEATGDADMSHLSRTGWTLSQLIEEWNYHRDERLGILCGSAAPEPWMIRLAETDANEAVKRLVVSTSSTKPIPLGGCPNDDH